jgi:protease I
MTDQKLNGKLVAILVDNGFEQIELASPRDALEQQGAHTRIVSPQTEHVRAWEHTDWGDTFTVDVPVGDADPDHYDALILPGGVMNPDKLRINPQALAFVRAFFDQHKPVAAICHGAWTLIDAGVVRGRTLTSYPSLRRDLHNAGAHWIDHEVVEDGNLISSRRPADLPAFNAALLAMLEQGVTLERQVSEAPHSSFSTGGGAENTGYDSPPYETRTLGNREYYRQEYGEK